MKEGTKIEMKVSRYVGKKITIKSEIFHDMHDTLNFESRPFFVTFPQADEDTTSILN
jgi:hypothetical protein